MKTPKDFLAERFQGVIRADEFNLNKLAIKLQRGRLLIKEGRFKGATVEEHGGLKLIRGPGGETANLFASKRGERVDLGIELEMPKIVIDYGLWSYHDVKEKWRVKKQTSLSLETIREYFWDRNLVLASCPGEIIEFLNPNDFFGDVLPDKFQGDAILLDPNAEKEITQFEEDGTYIIGGIVDRSNRIRTAELGYDLPRRSIKLDGDAAAVPDRINALVRIICKNVLGTPLEESIQQSRS